MAILLITPDYSPESSKVCYKMMKELASSLLNSGKDVIVIAPNEKKVAKKLECTTEENICVWRFRSGPLKNISHIQRGINESLLPFRGWNAIKKEIEKINVEGVVFYSPSIFLGPLARKITSITKAPSYMILRDFFPQWLIDIGMIKENSIFARYFKFVEKISYKAADTIGVMSPNNLTLFEKLHPDFSQKAEVLYNWTNPTINTIPSGFESIRKKLNLEDKIIFFYGGNIGHAQDMGNLMRLAIRLQDKLDAHFLFIGDGDEVELIKKLAAQNNLKNFSYLPYVSQEEYISILSEIDIGLFSLAANHTAHNFPGKVFGYMAHKIPVLGSVNKGNDLIDILNTNNAGLISINGEDDLLYENACNLLKNKNLRNEIAQNGLCLLSNQFSSNKAAEQILQALGISKLSSPGKI